MICPACGHEWSEDGQFEPRYWSGNGREGDGSPIRGAKDSESLGLDSYSIAAFVPIVILLFMGIGFLALVRNLAPWLFTILT